MQVVVQAPCVSVHFTHSNIVPPVNTKSKGVNLKSSLDFTVKAKETQTVSLGYGLRAPRGYVGRVSAALFDPIVNINPIFLPVSVNESLVLTVHNPKDEDVQVKRGDVLAHMVVLRKEGFPLYFK
jgi:dUTPase